MVCRGPEKMLQGSYQGAASGAPTDPKTDRYGRFHQPVLYDLLWN